MLYIDKAVKGFRGWNLALSGERMHNIDRVDAQCVLIGDDVCDYWGIDGESIDTYMAKWLESADAKMNLSCRSLLLVEK